MKKLAMVLSMFAATAAFAETGTETERWPLLQEGIASFGAAVDGHWLYVYGGHTGRAHTHSTANVSTEFRRLNLLDNATWEVLPGGPGMQSVAVIAYQGGIYRFGGMEPRNAGGEESDLWSSRECVRFDVASRKWLALPRLPEPRSSHDAVLIGSKVYVVGGWSLLGGERKWLDTAHVIDLAAESPKWKALPKAPFRRRALAVARLGTKVIAIGGITPEGKLSRKVAIFDPEKNQWTDGPEFPEQGFGASAYGVGESVYASGMKGLVYRLDVGATQWVRFKELFIPRFFHRLVARDDATLLAVGGATMGSHVRVIETVHLQPKRSLVRSWHIPFPGAARNRQGVVLRGSSLLVFGGNNSTEQHEFAPENFVAESWEINLADHRVRRLKDFPVGRQSFSTVSSGASAGSAMDHGERMRSGRVAYALGGFGHDGDVARSHAGIFRFGARGKRWTKQEAKLPTSRTQFNSVYHDGKIWIFGGLNYDPRREKGDRFHHDTAVWSWDLETEKFETPTQLPRPRRVFGGALVGESYYLVGGMADDFKVVEQCDVFSFRDGTWAAMPAPSRPRLAPQMVSLGGKLYLAGGSSREGERLAPNTTLEVFDPATGAWTVLLDKIPVSPRQMTMRAHRGRLVFYSLQSGPRGDARIAVLDP